MTRAPIAGNTQYPCIFPPQERGIPAISAAIPPTTCAWCLSEQGIPPGEGSHGICLPHAKQMLAQCRTRQRIVSVPLTPHTHVPAEV